MTPKADVAHLAEEDLGALTSKMKPLQSRLLCQWVEGLAPGGDRGTYAMLTRLWLNSNFFVPV